MEYKKELSNSILDLEPILQGKSKADDFNLKGSLMSLLYPKNSLNEVIFVGINLNRILASPNCGGSSLDLIELIRNSQIYNDEFLITKCKSYLIASKLSKYSWF